jgi:flagellar motor switch/type III secretory pathway protein FliN
MADQGPEFAASIHSACLANAGEAAAALQRAVGGSWQWSFSPVTALKKEDDASAALGIPEAIAKAGRPTGWGCSFKVENTAVLLLASDPADWFAVSDAIGASRSAETLQVLAQELGAALIPAVKAPGDCRAGRIDDLTKALETAAVQQEAQFLRATLTRDGISTAAWLLWPIANPNGPFAAMSEPATAPSPPTPPAAAPSHSPSPTPTASAGEGSSVQRMVQVRDLEDGLPLLPQFSRSLLRIRVPVIVTLAETRQTVGKVLEICPGSIIQFNKSCEESLALEVGSCKVAAGEAVKVGDKFGLRITLISPHQERFRTVRGRNS